MLLLRKKHEPQPASEPAEPPKSEENPVAGSPAPSSEAPILALTAYMEAPPPPPPADAIREAPAAEEAAIGEVPNRDERRLVIASGISFRGEISGCDHLTIDGAVEGEVKACRHIAVSERGVFKGIAVAVDAEIAGSCSGSLTVREKLVVARTAQLIGSVRYGCLTVEQGGELDGDIRRIKAEAGGVAAAPEKPQAKPVSVTSDTSAAAAAPAPSERDEIEGMFAAAVAARDLSRGEEAEALFKAVVARRPEHAAALAQLGKLARRRGARADALGYFEAAAKADPQNVWARCDAAAMLHELARPAEAKAIYEAVLEADPEHVGALSGLGQLAKERGDRAAALGYFEAAVAGDPGNPWVRCDAAEILRELARHEDAELMFKSVLETHPEHAAALKGLGHLARQRRDRAGALLYFEAAAKADPRNPWVGCDLANILRELSRFGEAEAMLNGVLETHPDHVGALSGLGHLARRRGELETARRHFEAALKIDAQNPDLRCELATVLRELSRFDEAEILLKAVIETHAHHVPALTGLGHLARQREDRGATLRWFEAAMEAEPEDFSVRVEFARALRQQGEFTRARQIIEKVLGEEASATSA